MRDVARFLRWFGEATLRACTVAEFDGLLAEIPHLIREERGLPPDATGDRLTRAALLATYRQILGDLS